MMTWLDDHDHLDRPIRPDTSDTDLEAIVELAELNLGDVTMTDTIVKFRQIIRFGGSCLNRLRKLAQWLEAMNIPREPNVMALHNAALAAAAEAEIKSAEAEATASATQAEREAAEKVAVQAHEDAKKAKIAFDAKKAEEIAAAAAAASGDLQVNDS